MKIQLRFFAALREKLGVSQESIDIPDDIKTIDDLKNYLCKRNALWSEVLTGNQVIRCALNQVMVDSSTPLSDDAEVAFFPPVTGG
ncbi:molybdopterin converting factor subunit 1 [Polynucleobacter paneuropaeus]|nr:molybdopterin converting factor subunit 1 [Polynucleobacter paneuropaeus]